MYSVYLAVKLATSPGNDTRVLINSIVEQLKPLDVKELKYILKILSELSFNEYSLSCHSSNLFFSKLFNH